jgi:hypothetical protein
MRLDDTIAATSGRIGKWARLRFLPRTRFAQSRWSASGAGGKIKENSERRD